MKVLLFGALRERCGAEALHLTPCPPTVEALCRQLEAQQPFLVGKWAFIRVAVNLEFASGAQSLVDSDEVALIPPVAGGVGHPRVRLSTEPLSLDAVVAQVRGPSMGGLCIFAGSVRNHAQGQAVERLEYSAYGDMASRVMDRIVSTAEAAHQARVACHHRVGPLQVGDLAVVIAAAAAHRAECFSAARQVIEALKQEVPIWKKEFGSDGTSWVGMGP
jgi:molybdopterin synthase catalytic subunit